MTAFLASVASLAEIEVAIAGGADIIDLKDPSEGALGAWPLASIREAVSQVDGRRPVSATVGNLPMDPARVPAAVTRTLDAGADFVKVGFFQDGDRPACIRALRRGAARSGRLVAVLFADLDPDPYLLPALADAGFMGVMLDTADKGGRSLREQLSGERLARFTAAARAEGLAIGLAGSLGLDDAPPLLALGPDFLGFRGALCGSAGRDGPLDPAAFTALRAAFSAFGSCDQSRAARHATATAGAQVPTQPLVPLSESTSAAKST